ncbi:prepilin-type N-terminal cleavage/methylation domain-containing protein, partial [Candidatus Woesebacteria bacterium]|nr:prepilin-type N-terminal cleavage/methylation domain-containing protein [Candidatus Woesebacteria bacterium]
MHTHRTQHISSGFTLVELIVVIAIIGILATIGVSSYQNVLKKSKETKIQSDLDDLKKGILVARIATGKTLGQITGNYCSACNVCWTAGDLRNVPDSHGCAVRWKNIITKVSAAGSFDITGLSRDAWGS